MPNAVYPLVVLAFLITQSLGLFGQLLAPTQVPHKPHKQIVTLPTCGDITGEYREPPKSGVSNVICHTTGFNTHRDACWEELAEYYYNVVPEPGVKTQHIYFVEVPKGTKPIRTLAELKNSPFKQQAFFKCTVNMTTGKFTFKDYPFAAK